MCISCNKSPFDFLITSGKLTNETRYTNEFTGIVVSDVFDVYLKTDTICKVEIQAGQNILPFIQTTVTDQTLTLNNTIKDRWARNYDRIKIIVSIKNLYYFSMLDASDIYSLNTIQASWCYMYCISVLGSMNITVNSYSLFWTTADETAGHYEIKGIAENLNLTGKGTSLIRADSLQVKNAVVNNYSIGNMYVNVSDTLNISITNTGQVYCTGNPVVYPNHMSNPNGLIFLNK